MGSDIGSSQIAFQQESTKVGESIDIITISDVSAGELNATVNIRILLTADQGPHGLGSPVLSLRFNRDQGACRSDEKILFQRRIIPFIVIELYPVLISASPTTFS